MLSWIALIVVLAALIVIGTWAWGSMFGHKPVPTDAFLETDVPAANRAALARGDINAIAFDVVPHGYRQEQVDDLLNALRDAQNQPENLKKD